MTGHKIHLLISFTHCYTKGICAGLVVLNTLFNLQWENASPKIVAIQNFSIRCNSTLLYGREFIYCYMERWIIIIFALYACKVHFICKFTQCLMLRFAWGVLQDLPGLVWTFYWPGFSIYPEDAERPLHYVIDLLHSEWNKLKSHFVAFLFF